MKGFMKFISVLIFGFFCFAGGVAKESGHKEAALYCALSGVMVLLGWSAKATAMDSRELMEKSQERTIERHTRNCDVHLAKDLIGAVTLCTRSSVAKGLYLKGDFEIDGEFDLKKLKILCQQVSYNNDGEYDRIVTGFEYDGEEIECEFGSTEGKGDELRFIEVGQIPSEGGCDE